MTNIGLLLVSFVCTANQSQTLTQAWYQRCLPYAIHSGSELLKDATVRQAIHDSFGEWQEQTCSDITFNFVDLEPWELEETCALDVVEREQGVTLETVGSIMNLTRERVRQVESAAKDKLKATGHFVEEDALD